VFRALLAASAVAVSLLGATAAAQAPAHAQPRPAALPGVRVVNLHRSYEARLGQTKPGKIAGIVYARGKQPRTPQGRPARLASCTEPACPLLYSGGPVQLSPHVYLLLWGPNWSTDPGQATSATYLENFYAGLGVTPQDIYSGITSQYGDSSGNPAFTGSVLVSTTQDTSTPPTGATQAQIAAEADAFATTQGITDLADAQIVVATQSGTCPAGFDAAVCPSGGTYCAWHSSSNEPYINLPYLLDAGTACGEDFVNTTGTDDGFSLVGGDEYADTITDPVPTGSATSNPAWVDTGDTVSGGQIAGKCAFGQTWSAGAPDTDMALSTGSFAMPSLWSNAAGGCVMSTVAKDTVTITSPGSVSGTVGSTVNLQLKGSSSGSYLITWRAASLPAGLALNSHTGLISGSPSTPGVYGVTVTVTDETGASRAVSFNWTVTPQGGRINGPNGKCLDDSGSGTANGNKVDIWTCNGTSAQNWTFFHGALSVLGTCLADASGGGAGTKLAIFTCNGQPSQTWSHRSNGEYVLALNGLCLTDPSSSSVNGTQVQIRTCQNFKDQHWSLP
jgi:hypothetical protein